MRKFGEKKKSTGICLYQGGKASVRKINTSKTASRLAGPTARFRVEKKKNKEVIHFGRGKDARIQESPLSKSTEKFGMTKKEGERGAGVKSLKGKIDSKKRGGPSARSNLIQLHTLVLMSQIF